VIARALLLLLLLAGVAQAQPPATNVDDARLYDVGSQLRCVVCQNLSVADSPSEMAQQMRAIVRERLAAGESPDQVVQYFVDKYGEWILLKPRRHGFNWLVWLAPGIAVALGLVLFAVVVRRWTRKRAGAAAAPVVDPAMRERIRREMDTNR
jgi:cytochrome c-type biogenesis protein CcmH